MKLVFLITAVVILHYNLNCQNNWTYIKKDSIPTYFISSIEAPNGDLIVLENNEIEFPNFKRQSRLYRFSSNGIVIDQVEISQNELNLYGSDLLKNDNYFLFVGMINYPMDSFRNDLIIRQYDYNLNLVQENIYPSKGELGFNMRTRLINKNYYICSIYSYNRSNFASVQNMFKFDLTGNLILQHDYSYASPNFMPFDFLSFGSNNDFIAMNDSYLIFNDSLRITKSIPIKDNINVGSNFIYLNDYNENAFLYYWLYNKTVNGDFDIGLSIINKNTLRITSTRLFGAHNTDEFPTFNRGTQRDENGNYYISGVTYKSSFPDTSTIVVAKLDSSLNTIWIRYINLNSYAICYNNTITNDDGLLISSMVSEPDAGFLFPQGCLIKINKNGEFGGTTSSGNLSSISGIMIRILDNRILINLSNQENKIEFTLYDIQGKPIIYKYNVRVGENELEFPYLVPGVYPYILDNNNSKSYQGKLFIKK
jgi:hypothetical protein